MDILSKRTEVIFFSFGLFVSYMYSVNYNRINELEKKAQNEFLENVTSGLKNINKKTSKLQNLLTNLKQQIKDKDLKIVTLKKNNLDRKSSLNELNINDDNVIINAIEDQIVDNSELYKGKVNNAKLDDDIVDNAKLDDDIVDNAKLDDEIVDNAKLDDELLDNAKLDDEIVDNAKLDDEIVDNILQNKKLDDIKLKTKELNNETIEKLNDLLTGKLNKLENLKITDNGTFISVSNISQ